MCVIEKLHEIYVAADDIVGFLDAALHKVAVDINKLATGGVTYWHLKIAGAGFGGQTPLPEQDLNSAIVNSKEASSLNLNFSLGQEAFNWNAVTSIKFDVDQ